MSHDVLWRMVFVSAIKLQWLMECQCEILSDSKVDYPFTHLFLLLHLCLAVKHVTHPSHLS